MVVILWRSITIEPFCGNRNFANQVVLITGASSGLGRGMALEFARGGASLLLVARRKSELDETVRLCLEANKSLKPSQVKAIAGDVASDLTVAQLSEAIKRDFNSKINFVVMNHAVIPKHLISELDYEKDLRSTMEINFFSTVRVIVSLNALIVQNKAKVIGIGTGGQHVPQLFLSAYGTAKWAMESFFDHYRLEHNLLKTGVKAQYIVVGEVATEEYVSNSLNGTETFPWLLEVEDACNRLVCLMTRDLDVAYMPGLMGHLTYFGAVSRSLWPMFTEQTWVAPKPYLVKRLEAARAKTPSL